MKQILEFLPLIIFFAVYKFFDIYIATGALIIATFIQLVVTYILFKKIEKMLLVTFAMVAVFGTLTIVFHDDNFIKWKVTLIYMLFAALLVGSQLMNRSVLKSMLGKELEAPDRIWRNLTFYWAGFFAVCAAINIYIAYNFSLETWVNFKVFGLTILSIINLIGTIAYLYPHLPQEEKDKE